MNGVSALLECTTQQSLCLASAQRGEFIKAGILPASKINETSQTHFEETPLLMKRIVGPLAVSLVTLINVNTLTNIPSRVHEGNEGHGR